jgi:hypothetical protein
MQVASWLFVLQLSTIQPADACWMKGFSELLLRGGGILGGSEAAAFVVRETDGSISFVMWPRTEFAKMTETFRGTIPTGTIAIAHTHPTRLDRPSSADMAEAVRLQLPIYVVTFWVIWMADPASQKVMQVTPRHWTPVASRSACGPRIAEMSN